VVAAPANTPKPVMTSRFPGAVVLGGYANGVSLVRSLAAGGVPVAVVRTRRADMAHLSRFVAEHHELVDSGSRSDALLDLLESKAADWRGWALFPTNDDVLEVLSRYHDRLSLAYRLTFPPWEIARRVLRKELTHEAAREIGIATPACYGESSRAKLREMEFRYPLLVKPSEGHVFSRHFGKKLFLARNRDELQSAVARVEAEGVRCQLLDYVPGPDRHHVHYQLYVDRQGEPSGDFALRKLRQSPPYFGVARAAIPASVPELRERTVELLRELGWWGMASVAYKLDSRSGRYRFMEVNGRCFLSHGLARRAGINFPLLGYAEAVLDERPSGVEQNGWQGTWLHLHADLLYTARWFRSEGLDWAAFRRSYTGPKTYAVWSGYDPLPFLAEWSWTARKVARMPFRRDAREEVAGRVQWPDELGGPGGEREADDVGIPSTGGKPT